MDAVVLAAGRGSRLDGIAAPFHKPLLIANAKPIVCSAVDMALRVGCTFVTVVVAPENALPVSQVLGGRAVHLVVQRSPSGPGHALLVGLHACRSEQTLVLMGDNVTSFATVEHVVEQAQGDVSAVVVGVQPVDESEVTRFTYFSYRRAIWIEKEPPLLDDEDPGTGMFSAWIGPLVLPRSRAQLILNSHATIEQELPIGPYLSEMGKTVMVSSDTIDIGVPEALS